MKRPWKTDATFTMAAACLSAALAVRAAEPAAPVAEQAKSTAPANEDLSATAQPRVRTSPDTNLGSAADASKVKPAGPDRLQLDTSVVTGNRELPKVLYIVPWKKADIGELPSQPFNSLLDEILAPLDRDVFRREIGYFSVITGQAGTAVGTVTAAPQGASDAQIRAEK